ncbi:cysteine dioxygenase family protein [Sciscionella marina]|uniref:cysteine dioxygenase family protein n=1 Tax=Sciscionella marina TaxID=508770 RepID=UPI00036AA5E0|nr:cysteine dioxygenase family protein [Sciscionella marina]
MLESLVTGIRAAVCEAATLEETAQSVAAWLEANRPRTGLLTAAQRRGNPEHYEQHVLHVEPDGSFSVVALVWLPGQETPVHDHLAWCVVTVLEGTEHETVYRLDEHAGLVQDLESENPVGSVSCCIPPGDIHKVTNIGAETAISLHVYGADIVHCGSSIKRTYALDHV